MIFESEHCHPNGLKIAIALNLRHDKVSQTKVKLAHDGAVLHVLDPLTHTTFCMSSNSAVMFLLSASQTSSTSSLESFDWLEWESCSLQRNVLLYLQSIASGREDKTIKVALTQDLQKIEKFLASSSNSNKQLNVLDVALFGTLYSLTSDSKAVEFLRQFPAVIRFLDATKAVQSVKEALGSFFGAEACPPPKSWVSSASVPPSVSVPHTLTLLKTSPAADTNVPSKLSGQSTPSSEAKEESISAEEIEAAKKSWTTSLVESIRKKQQTTPVLPVKGERNILITSALPYVNNVPHLGNIIGCVLSGDCFARYCRLRGDNVAYICGTDEYGTATETKAIAEGLTPRQICDKYHKIHSDVYKAFNIKFDHFGRTTTDNQTKIVQELFWDLEKAKKISRDSVEQLFCDNCERFLADRFVEGTCPHIGCGYEDARGDQCDACGKLVNAADLIKPRCKLCSATPRIKSSNHLFIDLPAIEGDLRKWFNESSKQWTHNASTICKTWLRDGLHARCITRDLKWGVPVPLEGFDDKVFYVWFDAPIGYISITAEYTDQWEKWWKNPNDVKLYQFMAKDNVPFHGIIFPCTLTGSPKPWTRVNNLCATEYLNYEDGKFSKSRGVGVFGDEAMETGIPSDVWRFYLLYIRPESHDTSFSWADLQMKNNTELLNNLGNFVNRSLKFVSQFFDGKVPDVCASEADYKVIAAVNKELKNYHRALASTRLRDGLRHILAISRIGNLYIQENEPYKLIKNDRSADEKARGASVVALSANLVYLVALLLDPYMPDTAALILKFINKPAISESKIPELFCHCVLTGNLVTKPEPLIRKITDDEIKALQEKFKGEAEVKKAKTAVKSAANTNCSGAAAADPSEIERLTKLVAEQGNKVRALKAGGASKADVAPEVAVLLQLKQQLTAAQGSAGATQVSASKKGAKTPKATDVPKTEAASANTTTADKTEADRLQLLVTEQGNKVRQLKSSGASADEVKAEVNKLLELKNQLGAAMGVDPATIGAPAKGKKKKK